jgi:2-dehydropantoate 2-reductase
MGSVYAALLASAGNDVWAVDVNAAHVEAIRAGGLRVEGASGDRTVRVGATTDASEVGEADLVVIATKAFDAGAAARSALPLIGAGTTVLTIQNGLGAADVVAEVVGDERLMVGVAGGFGASIVGPAHAHHHGLELVRLGERAGPATERTERVAEVWRAAGFTVKTYDDVERLLWEKLICNACFAGLGGVLELTIGQMIDNPHAWELARRCARETLDVGRACGVALDIDDCDSYVREYGLGIPDARRGRVDQRLRPPPRRRRRRPSAHERADHRARAREERNDLERAGAVSRVPEGRQEVADDPERRQKDE